MMIQSVIIDDDEVNIALLKSLLNIYCPDIEVKDTATNIEDGLKAIGNQNPEILFLDIEIHNRTGFDLLNLLEKTDMQVVLITAHEKYAIQAFKFAVVDYVLKPIKIEALIQAVNSCKLRLEKIKTNPKQLVYKKDKLAIHEKGEVVFIQFDDIIHLEASGACTEIYWSANKKTTSSKSLKELEAHLPETTFIRVHNSHIIHLKKVVKVLRQKHGVLVMINNREIPISETRKKAISDILDF
jgi:two-component system, LytTR family, response regulator